MNRKTNPFAVLKRTVISVFLFCLPLTTFSQELKFNHITSKDGLSQAVVNCVVKDKKGFMWFGTQDGLNKYDGYTITVFRHDPSDSTTLADNYINCLFVDNQNVLWVGTNGGGLDSYDPLTGSFSHHDASVNSKSNSDNIIRAIFEDNDGMFWIGTENGLSHFDTKTGVFTPSGIKKENLSVRAIIRDQKGRLWFSSYGSGLYLYDPIKKSYHNYDLTIGNNSSVTALEKANNTRTLFINKYGRIYIGTNGGGMILFDPELGKVIQTYVSDNQEYGNSIGGGVVTSITEDEKGIMWIGTMVYGITEFDPNTQRFKVHRHRSNNPSSLGNDNVRCIFTDDQGNFWFGTNGGGVDVYFKSAIKFKHYLLSANPAFSSLSNNIYSIIQDYDGMMWIGAFDAGLIMFDIKTGAMKSCPDYINFGNRTVTAIYQDRDSIIWAGTYGSGLSCFNKRTGKVTHFTGDGSNLYNEETSPIKNGTITCITQDSRGLIWIATYGGGVYYYDKVKKQFSSYRTTNGLSSDFVYNIYEDKSGNMWIGTQNGGASVFDFAQKKITAIYKSGRNGTGLSSNIVNNFYEDEKGMMWIATANGLNKFDKRTKRFNCYFIKDGLANDYIYSIIPDDKGNMWMTTNKGVAKFDPKIENKEGAAFKNYDKNDGLQDDEFSQGAFFKNPKTSEIFIGGLNGFNTFTPSKMSVNTHQPPVFITSYRRSGIEIKLDTVIYDKRFIELNYKDNFFSFEFVALDYVFPEKNQYMYKMEGLDEDWSPANNHRYASYTNLEGGEYRFRVKGSNNDGVWNEIGTTLVIRIIPPFWKTKLFYALCVILGIALVFGFIRWRTASIKKEKRILEGKVEERTAELAQKNKDITSSIQYAKRIQMAILPPLTQIKTHLPQSFVLYKPKDIVSGDFYWFGEKNGKKIIAAVDCTGHGVPGAFMSMIGNNLLNAIVLEKGMSDPGQILNELNLGVQNSLKQGSNEIETSDGMDVAICAIDMNTREVQFAGAYRPFVLVSDGKIEKIPGNKFPIGGKQDKERNFKSHTRMLKKGDTIYMFSDGYADQFGGEKGKKFMIKQLDQLLLEIQNNTMPEQEKKLDDAMVRWKGDYEQVDDILLIGIRM